MSLMFMFLCYETGSRLPCFVIMNKNCCVKVYVQFVFCDQISSEHALIPPSPPHQIDVAIRPSFLICSTLAPNKVFSFKQRTLTAPLLALVG